MKPQFAHRVKKPFLYISSESTDVAKTIKRVKEAMKVKTKPTNVRPMKRVKEAA